MTENSLQIFNQKNNEIFQDNRNNKNPNQNSISNNINCTNAIQILISELAFIFFMGLILLIIYVIPEYHNAKISKFALLHARTQYGFLFIKRIPLFIQ